jgi:hypothetical protein
MTKMKHGGTEFVLQAEDGAWRLARCNADGSQALVGAGLFAGMAPQDAERQARVLLHWVRPSGVRLVGPDLGHPARAGDLRLIAPDVAHSNFVFWEADDASPAR